MDFEFPMFWIKGIGKGLTNGRGRDRLTEV
jgi:hypothetical protein